MRFNEFIDLDIPILSSYKGLKRIIVLKKARFLFPSYDAVWLLRYVDYYSAKGNKFQKLRVIFYRRLLVNRYNIFYSSSGDILGYGLKLPHPCSIIFGSGAKLGNNVCVYQDVTIGAKNVGEAINNAYPVIMDNCVLYAGCKIIGPITLNSGSVVGANSVLIGDTECNSVYAGVPAKRIR